MKPTLIALLFCLISATAKSDDRPNLILIIVDGMNRDGVSCYGAQHQTPNVDRLAKQGVRYETAWCIPIDTSTQVTLLTGQYPFRHGWLRHDDVPRWGGEGLNWKKFTTFARSLRDSGYTTAIGGKWQINDLEKQSDALKQVGFDEHCVWTGVESDHTETRQADWNGHTMTNGRRTTGPYKPHTINSFLINFIQRKREKPFLVFYPMPLAHALPTTNPQNKMRVTQGEESPFAGNVNRMDQLIGELVEAVESTGLGQNTLIVFTGGNGSAAAGISNKKPSAKRPDRESDWGAHVPFVVRAPFLTSGDRVSRDLIDFTDLYPTFLELAEIAPPKDARLDGRSFVPSLRDSEDPFEKRNWIFSQAGDFRMIRDWQHFLDSRGNFHDLNKDPLQQSEVSPLDKIAPGRRQRLEMILNRFPENAPAPFLEDGPKNPGD